MRNETMSGIWRSPELKPKAATQSPQRITTSTPNIISGRCRRTELRAPNWTCKVTQQALLHPRPLAWRGRAFEEGATGPTSLREFRLQSSTDRPFTAQVGSVAELGCLLRCWLRYLHNGGRGLGGTIDGWRSRPNRPGSGHHSLIPIIFLGRLIRSRRLNDRRSRYRRL
jgi:hypothetical protein